MRRMMLLAGLLAGAAAPPLHAQEGGLGPRVERLEGQMRAVQRKVFPGGDARFFEPEIAPQVAPVDPAGSPATTPVADLTARVSALEGQLQTLTGQAEQNAFKLKQLEDAFAAYRTTLESRLSRLEGGAPGAAVTGDTAAPFAPAVGGAGSAAATLPAGLDAIEKPVTDDAGDDAYTYGYRLWEAKFYPQAQAQLKAVVEKYPKHRRVSFAQNLLGRAYLDEGKPALASVAFYDNYQKRPQSERAPDSLYWLGVSLTRLNKLPDACKVFDEFGTVYGATASASLKAQVAKGRTEAKCGA